MLQIVGTCAEIQTEEVPASGDREAFTSQTIVMRSLDGNTRYVRVARGFAGPLPVGGQHVTLGVFASAYAKKDGTLQVQLTAHTNLGALAPVG